MKLLQIIRIYRAFRGLKLKALAEEMGLSPRELGALEAGKSPSGTVLAKVLSWALAEELDLRHPAAVTTDKIIHGMKINDELKED